MEVRKKIVFFFCWIVTFAKASERCVAMNQNLFFFAAENHPNDDNKVKKSLNNKQFYLSAAPVFNGADIRKVSIEKCGPAQKNNPAILLQLKQDAARNLRGVSKKAKFLALVLGEELKFTVPLLTPIESDGIRVCLGAKEKGGVSVQEFKKWICGKYAESAQ